MKLEKTNPVETNFKTQDNITNYHFYRAYYKTANSKQQI